jgi:hypothetical protein
MTMLHALVLATLLMAQHAATSFVLQPQQQQAAVRTNKNARAASRRFNTSPHVLQPTARLTTVQLRMAGEGENEVNTQEPSSSSVEEEKNEKQQEQEVVAKVEDPELVKLKEEIHTLELTLKSRRQQVQTMQDRAEHYSKAGYARKVAEMENMRRDRSVRCLIVLLVFIRYHCLLFEKSNHITDMLVGIEYHHSCILIHSLLYIPMNR